MVPDNDLFLLAMVRGGGESGIIALLLNETCSVKVQIDESLNYFLLSASFLWLRGAFHL